MNSWILIGLVCCAVAAFAQDDSSLGTDKLENGEVETSDSASSADAVNAFEADSNTESTTDTEVSDSTSTLESESVQEEPAIGDDTASTTEAAEETVPLESPQEETARQAPEKSSVQDAADDAEVSQPDPDETLQAPQQLVSNASNSEVGDFELRLNRIYTQFYSEALSDDAWKQIAGEKLTETYTIQSGDTLWDISVTFFGNGHYWPKVWQLNEDITNPHLISPGYQIKFVPGQLEQAPQVNITQNNSSSDAEKASASIPLDTASSEVAASEMTSSEALTEELVPVIPPPTKKSRKALKTLPPSLPLLVSKKYEEFDKDGFSRVSPRAATAPGNIYLTSYISDVQPESLGKIVENNIADIEVAGLYDTVFIQIASGAQPNEQYLIYKTGDEISSSQNKRAGHQIFCQGEVRIIEIVNADKNIYKGLITKSVNPVLVGSSIMKGSIPLADIEDVGSSAAATSGEIVGGDFESERYLFGPQQVVYIDRGTEDGVQNGNIFSVRKNNQLRNPETVVKELRDQIARIKVVKTSGQFSTAFVLGSREDIRIGDRFTSSLNGETPILKQIKETAEEISNTDTEPVDGQDEDETDASIEE